GRLLGSAARDAFVTSDRVLLAEGNSGAAPASALRPEQRARGYVLFSRDYHEAMPHSYQPSAADVGRPLWVWATPGEYEPATFGVYALKALQEARVTVSDLHREGGGGKIPAASVDVRLARFWPQRAGSDATRFRILPELLEAVQTANLPSTRISQYWLTLRVPETAAPGDYRGLVTLRARNAPASSLKLLVKVLPFKLARPKERTWCLYADSRRWSSYSENELAYELRDIKAHGLTSLVLSPLAHVPLRYEKERLAVDFGPLARLVAAYTRAGLHAPLVLDVRDLAEATARARGGDATPGDAETRRLFTVFISELALRAAADGWPDCLYQVGADPTGPPVTAEALRPAVEALRRAALSSLALLSAPDAAQKEGGALLDVPCYAPQALAGSAELAAAVQKALRASGKAYWTYCLASGPTSAANEGNVLVNRYLAGVGFLRSGAAGLWIASLQQPVGDPYNDFDGPARDACLTYPTPNGQPLVPTIQWEGLREGIDDAAYLHTFHQMVARMKASPRPRVSNYARQV
ncbi:MAG: hypothetical protein QHJ73_17985, partial [Armatimonadota bacterium]|nr:hypothetical protein [Armatimonadota bacterium]